MPLLALALVLLTPLGLVTPAPVRAQVAATSRADSSALVKEARDRQRDFERFRQSLIPVEVEREEGRCDVPIGRMCIWYGGEDEADFPEEFPDVGLARRELLQLLARADAQIGDPWIKGQHVHYLVESGALGEAERVARQCGIAETWWCSALLGYVLHLRGEWVAAEAAFQEASATLPKDRRERWLAPRYILSDDAQKDFKRGTPEERERRWSLFWRLSDPLYLVEGNDRLTDHFARWVEAETGRDAESPQGLFWDEDLEETLVRYGRTIGWSRTHSPQSLGLRTGLLTDTRRVVAHHHPKSRGYLFPEEFLRSPSDVPPESWITAPREARTWYAPPYAPDFNGLETQVGRFRRGDEMLVVGAYRPGPPVVDVGARVVRSGPGRSAPPPPPAEPPPMEPVRGPVEAGLFLVPEDGGALTEVRGSDAEGVFTLRAPPSRYVSSLEVLDAAGKRAWRARQGIRQIPLAPGLVAVSDLLILEKGASEPASLEEAVPLVRHGVRVSRGERFTVVWEVYGLRVQQAAQVTLGFTKGRPGFLARVGSFMGVIRPERAVEITFEEAGPDVVQSVFRAMTLELPDLEPGEYTLHLRLDLPGREPAITSRPIVVEE